MPPSKTRFVTACQQMLALAVVLAALTPAASVVSLDVVREAPGTPAPASAGHAATAALAAYTPRPARRPSVPPSRSTPTVTRGTADRRRRGAGARRRATCRPAPRSAPSRAAPRSTSDAAASPATARSASPGRTASRSAEDQIALPGPHPHRRHLVGLDDAGLPRRARPRPGQRRGPARPARHRPAAGRQRRPGPGARRHRRRRCPADMKLAVIDPGPGRRTPPSERAGARHQHHGRRRRRRLGLRRRPAPQPADAATDGAIGLAGRGRTRRKPVIYSRAQWGADESMRDKSSLHYGDGARRLRPPHGQRQRLHARPRCPAILRSIYAYHTQSRGWSDIGYNFLVDRFGRIWEGRYGGVDRPVVGAHTLGYNDYSFAMSAIGNYEIAQPPARDARRPTARCSPGSSRCTASTPSSTQQWVGRRYVPGDQRPPRRRPDRLPGPVPLRQDPADPAAGRRRPARLGGPRARVQPRLDAAPRPRRAPGQRRPGASSSRPAA